MRILFLGYTESKIPDSLRKLGHSCMIGNPDDRITHQDIADCGIEQIISFGYRKILKQDVLDSVKGRAINLHISLLPFGRGSHPLLWANLENSPTGVTIHVIDSGVDTGKIILQRQMELPGTQTLKSGHAVLKQGVEELFIKNMSWIVKGEGTRTPQLGKSTCHGKADAEKILTLLPKGWDTTLRFVRHLGVELGLRK